jgi:hypothetical protein
MHWGCINLDMYVTDGQTRPYCSIRTIFDVLNSLLGKGNYRTPWVLTYKNVRILPDRYIHLFCTCIRTNTDYFPVQHFL